MTPSALAILAFAMVATFMTLIMTRRLSAMVALIVVPIAFGLLAGFGPALGAMMLAGIRDLAPTGVMILFAILFFGVMIDAGLFDPLIARIVSVVGNDPVRIIVGTAMLALVVSLDGDGTTTYMISVSAMLPLYRRLQLDARKMACVIIMAAAITNLVPWGGPTARAATALGLDPAALFVPMVPALLTGAAWLLFVAYVFGIQERRRLSDRNLPATLQGDPSSSPIAAVRQDVERNSALVRSPRFVINLLLTGALMVALLLNVLPLPVLFMIAYAFAVLVNYPSLQQQKERLHAHAGNALAVVGLIFAAGIFTGILSGTGMVDAMAGSVVGIIPAQVGGYMAPITALLSIPFTFLISNDAFYFGMLPILVKAAAAYGIEPAAIARASLVGQQIHLLSPLVPSTYLLVGMSNIEFGAHQRFTLPWALGSCLVVFVSSVLFGVFPWSA